MIRFVFYIGFLSILISTQQLNAQNDLNYQAKELIKHTVSSKETLYSISREYGVTVDDLLKTNKGLNVNIKPGQIILVPMLEQTDKFVIYHVTSNTTLTKVAGLYQVPLSLLKAENPALDNKLYPGQKVKVPVGNKAKIKSEVPSEKNIQHVDEVSNLGYKADVKSKCDQSTPNRHKEFRVALMIPFYLEKYDSITKDQFLTSEKNEFASFRFIGFYEGALIAVDSLKKLGMNIRFFVYDVGDNVSKTSQLLTNPELREMDLIIGPFLNKSFDLVARFAGENNIPIVNPFSTRDEVVQNYKTVIKVKPGVRFQDQLVAQVVQEKFSEAKVFLVLQSSGQNAEKISNLQNSLQQVIPSAIKISNSQLLDYAKQIADQQGSYYDGRYLSPFVLEGVQINPAELENKLDESTVFNNKLTTINYSSENFQALLSTASSLRNSLFIIYGDNKSFVMDVMNKLNEYRNTLNIKIIGMPNWEKFTYLDYRQCNDMNLIYLSSVFTDFDDRHVERFNYYFRERFSIEPGEYALSGFDLTYFFLTALFYHDKSFAECLDQSRMNLLQNGYQFQRIGSNDNFENSYWNILEYRNYRLNKLSFSEP